MPITSRHVASCYRPLVDGVPRSHAVIQHTTGHLKPYLITEIRAPGEVVTMWREVDIDAALTAMVDLGYVDILQ